MQNSHSLCRALPLARGGVIKNRLFKSAMSEALAHRDGAPVPQLNRLYATWAAGGIGLAMTGNVMIDRRALGEPGNVVIEDESHLQALRQWATAATAHDTQCWVQLNHPGKQAPVGLNAETVAPSAVPFRADMQRFFATARALQVGEIEELIQRFARAAGIVKKAGFNGVQIHGAHGYLVSQFLSPHHNQRQDDWGGSPQRRRRFVREVYRAMRAEVGEDFPIGIKLNSADFQRGGLTQEESLDTLRELEALGIDLIEISGGTYEAPAMTGRALPAPKQSTLQREAYFMEFAQQARQAVRTPLVLTGGFRSVAGMAQALESGAVDMVGIARITAIEPDAPLRLLAGDETRHKVRPILTGIKAVDKGGLMEIAWYTAQLRRIGAGQAPRPQESGLWALLKMMARRALGARKRPQRLRAQ